MTNKTRVIEQKISADNLNDVQWYQISIFKIRGNIRIFGIRNRDR